MESQMQDQNKGKGRVKPKIIKDSALTAGLEAIRALEDLEIATRPVQATAKTLVEEAIESIMRSRSRGVPLLRIYTDAKKAAGLKISFQTFSSYVCEAAKEKGLRIEKKKAAPSPAASPTAGTAQAPASDAIMLATQQNSSWNCERCSSDSSRHESTKHPGRFFWRCSSCGTCYADNDGAMTDQKL